MTEQLDAPRIVIVEDSLGVARSLSLGLGLSQRHAYQTETCSSGEEALKLLLETHADLLITDLRLPGIDGLSLLERVRHFSPTTRSILITAFGSPDVEDRARLVADAYITKPFMLQDVLGEVERILETADRTPGLGPPGDLASPEAGIPQVKPDMRRSVHLTVLACDYDGTLAEDDQVETATWEMLRTARIAGVVHILVTGRTLDSIMATGGIDELFEAIVAENGAVVYFPKRKKVVLPFGTVDLSLLRQWQTAAIPLERGLAIAATVMPYDEVMLHSLRSSRASVTVTYNRSAVMVLPAGATKGTGLMYALEELGYSPHNVIACGDAENDRNLFEVAEIGVAVANATLDLRAAADAVLPLPAGAGVRALLADLLDGKTPAHRPRPERSIVLGNRISGAPVRMDPFTMVETNLGILGSSASGKSWLAGLVVEELLKQKYQVCIIDPEGDYRALGASPRTLLLGGAETPLPSVASVLNAAEWNNVSLVLDLSLYDLGQRYVYLCDFLRALRGLRARRGRPHFFLVDEIQNFCPPAGGELTDLLLEAMQWGGFGLVSYRPSLVAQPLLERLDQLLITRLGLPEEIGVVAAWLRGHKNAEETLAELPSLPRGQAYLCTDIRQPSSASRSRLIRFRVGGRAVPHVRHLHKYLGAPLPEHKRFYFRTATGQFLGAAASLWEFRERLVDLPLDSLRFHMERKDFTRWISDSLDDDELARRISKITASGLKGEVLRRALQEVVAERYDELETLA